MRKVDKAGLCLGCGLCEAVYGKDQCKMTLGSDGFFHPQFIKEDAEKEKILRSVCPSLNVVNTSLLKKNERIWGKIAGISQGYAYDEETRTKGSSGGAVSAIAIHVLRRKYVDAVLHVGGDKDNYNNNYLKVSRTREQVIANTSSRYAPALIFDHIISILESSDESYCFVGKPCDIAGLNNFLKVYPGYQDRFRLTVAIFCAGMPSFIGTDKLVQGFNPKQPVNNLTYRGNGWPGNFSFVDQNGTLYNKSYNDSWGKVLNKHLAFRCKICPEGIGLLADIAIGDAWETENGYPDFSEKEGYSLMVARTERGKMVVKSAVDSGDIFSESVSIDKLKLMQPYQYRRRKFAYVRMFAASLAKGVTFNFRGLYLVMNTPYRFPKRILKEFYGTFKRAVKTEKGKHENLLANK